MKNPRRA